MRIFTLLFVFNILINTSYGFQEKEISDSSKAYFQLQSIHFDFTSAIFINDLSISSDFEIYKTKIQTFGIQGGFNRLYAGDVGGSKPSSPVNDFNLLAYSSIGYDKIITMQLMLGYTYRISDESYVKEYPVGGIKAGISFMLNFNKYLRLYFKYSRFYNSTDFGMSAVGLGFSFGWTR